MSTSTARAGARIDRSQRTLALAVGDLLLIAVFVVAGELSHGISPVEQPWLVLDTAAPFYIGWLLVAPLAGLYGARALETPRRAALLAAGAWIGAALIGQLLRGTTLFHGGLSLPFVLVSIGVGLALLVPWRTTVSALG
jgi:hypothetical protein